MSVCPECNAPMTVTSMPDSGRYETLCERLMRLRLLRHMDGDKRRATHGDLKEQPTESA